MPTKPLTCMDNMADDAKVTRFQATILPHLASALNLARWLTGHDQDAEDLAQESYLRAFRYFDSFDGRNCRAWLLSIVRNVFYSSYRARQSAGVQIPIAELTEGLDFNTELLNFSANTEVEQVLMRHDDHRLVHQALQRLPAEFREILVLRELEDLPYKEISMVAGIPIGTVMSRLARARKMLADHLLKTCESGCLP